MAITQEEMTELVSNLSESLNVEVKRWIDPRSTAGEAKIVQATFALRNRNGGYLVVGFDDATLAPDDAANRPTEIEEAFHADVVQAIISRNASQPFEVWVGIVDHAGSRYPIIKVQSGVVVPVATKREIRVGDRPAVLQDRVYFRTLRSNGRVSSSTARAEDWRDLLDICFDNREADIGRFLRRHLAGVPAATGLLGVGNPSPPQVDLRDALDSLRDEYDARRLTVFNEADFAGYAEALRGNGSWQVIACVQPPLESNDTNVDFLNRALAANPRYTGWPAWLDSRNFTNPIWRPRKVARHWETVTHFNTLDFYRIHGRGEFYMFRTLEDDSTDRVEPRQAFDPTLMIFRVCEAILVAMAMARAVIPETDDPAEFEMAISFKWSGLRGRELRSWSDRMRYISQRDPSFVDEAEGYALVSLDTPPDAIAPYVKVVTNDLFSNFGGFEVPVGVIEQLLRSMLSRTF